MRQKNQLTQKEVHALGIRCRWYQTLTKMRECMNRHLLTRDQINATAMTDPQRAAFEEGKQLVYREVSDGLDSEISSIDDGLKQFNAIYGLRAYQMFYQYFVNREKLEDIAKMHKTSASSVRRAIRMIGNGHPEKGGSANYE